MGWLTSAATLARAALLRCSKCGVPKRGHICPYKDDKDGSAPSSSGPGTPMLGTPTTPRAPGSDAKRKVASAKKKAAKTPEGGPNSASKKRKNPGGAAATPTRAKKTKASSGGRAGATPSPSLGALLAGPRGTCALLEIFSRLDPRSLARAGGVCREWRSCAQELWANSVECTLTLRPGDTLGGDRQEEGGGQEEGKGAGNGAGLRGTEGAGVAPERGGPAATAAAAAAAATAAAAGWPWDRHPAVWVARRSPGLEVLRLQLEGAGACFGDAAAAALAAACPKNLRQLKVSVGSGGRVALSGPGLQALLQACGSLESLELWGCAGLRELRLKAPLLRDLHLFGCESLEELRLECPLLEALSLDTLSRCPDVCEVEVATGTRSGRPGLLAPPSPVTDAVAVRLLRQVAENCPGLTWLHIACPAVGDLALEALVSGPAPPPLQHLAVVHSAMTDAGAEALSEALAGGSRLTHLDLSGNAALSERTLEAVARAFRKSLQALNVAGCPQLSVSGVQVLAQTLPRLTTLDCGYSLLALASEERAPGRPRRSHRRRDSFDGTDAEDELAAATLSLSSPRLRTLSLWGCSAVRSVNLACPKLRELCLRGCTGLQSEHMALSCPRLAVVRTGDGALALREGLPRRLRFSL